MKKIIIFFFITLIVSTATTFAQSKKDLKVKHISASTYNAETAKGIVLVDFWASWCAPCRRIAPVLDELAADSSLKLRVAKLDVDDNKALAMEKGVKSIPTLILYKDGKEITRFMGVYTFEELKSEITKALK